MVMAPGGNLGGDTWNNPQILASPQRAGTFIDINQNFAVYPNNANKDSSVGINQAIAALGQGPGTARLTKVGVYRCDNPIIISNGSVSALATNNGIFLEGPTPVSWALGDFLGSPYQNWSAVLRAGPGLSGQTNVVQVSGPAVGCGVRNILIDANNITSYGLDIISAVGGMYEFIGCMNGGISALRCRAIAPTSFTINTTMNHFRNISLLIPVISFGKGLVLDGNGVNVNSNTSHNLWENIVIEGPSPNTTVTTIGCLFRDCDNESFQHLVFLKTGITGGGTNACIQWDFTGFGAGNFPTDMTFEHVDFGTSAASMFSMAGTPNGNLMCSRFIAIANGNGKPANPNLAGVYWDPASQGRLLDLGQALTNVAAAQTATLTNGPVAGNPTKWVQINDNGTLRSIPTW